MSSKPETKLNEQLSDDQSTLIVHNKVYWGIGDDGRVHVQDPRTAAMGQGRSLKQALDDMARQLPSKDKQSG